MTRRIKVTLSDERDIPLLGFLWRWKVVSTRALHAKFFSRCSVVVSYHRLNRLERAGFVKSVCDERAKNFHWTLTKRGFLTIRSLLPELCEDGFASEHVRHDALVTAIHLGDWLLERPTGVQMFSEQQLRRFAESSRPDWVPSPSIHRPDGYWGFPHQGTFVAVALEVELGHKSSSFYQSVGDYYREEQTVSRVLWLVEIASHARCIQMQIGKTGDHRDAIHNFVAVDQFLARGWLAEVCFGPDQGSTIRATLEHFLQNQGRQPAVNSSSTLTTQHFLDTRKSQVRLGS